LNSYTKTLLKERLTVINNITLLGRLTDAPELRYTPSGVAVANFTLAVDRKFTNAQGERETDFFDIICWRQLAETAANYLKKGQQAALEGSLQTRYYENREGKKVKVVEIVASNIQFLSAPGGQNNSSNQSGNRTSAGAGTGTGQGQSQGRGPINNDPFADQQGTPIDINDDDLPF
jgi:single-strand DNA-binding protein